jgi:hypothetical protein
MSLEAQLKDLNDNLARLCAALEANGPVEVTSASGKPVMVAEGKPAPKKKAAAKKEEPVVEKEEAAADDGVLEGNMLDYVTDVKPFVLANAKAHREEIVGILSRFGCKKATELKPEQYGEFLARLKNTIENGLETDSGEDE